MKTVQNFRMGADFLGIGLSFLCLIHCMVFPFLVAFAPELLKGLPGDDVTHRILALMIGFVGWIAFRSGYRVHRKRWVLGIFLAGMALIAIAALLGESVLSARGEIGITVCGSFLLVAAHLFNHSFCRTCVVRDCQHPLSSSNEREGNRSIEANLETR